MIRVLVVDDSAFMRKALSMMLEKAPDIHVVGTARDGLEGLDLVERLSPDVVTMDVEMPRMNGLTALRRIMRTSPRPVLMVSSLTQEGAATTVQALAAGAVDFIPKEHSMVSLSITQIENELHAKVRAAAASRPPRLRRSASPRPTAAPPGATGAPAVDARRAPRMPHAEILVIGVSTGGPFALQEVIPALPASFPVPVAVVQHMPPHFTRSLAERLDAQSALEVREAEPGLPLTVGRVVIARGGEHLAVRRPSRTGPAEAALSQDPADLLHRPSADVLFESAADAFGRNVLALVMTGMGRDGLEGARRIRQRGGVVLAQDEASCVVYGMPRAVVEADVAAASVPLDRIAETLTRALAWTSAPPVSAA